MAASATPMVRGSFIGEVRAFGLTLVTAKLLEQRLDLGTLYLEAIFRSRQQRLDHIEAVLLFGLIGAGVEEAAAQKLVADAVKAGWILRYCVLCHEIICAFLGEAEEEAGK